MRNLRSNNHGAVQFILMGILILVMSVLAINIVYPIMNAGDATIDATLATKIGENTTSYKPMKNASIAVLNGANTVMGINPLAALVAVAAGILTLLMAAFTPQGGQQI